MKWSTIAFGLLACSSLHSTGANAESCPTDTRETMRGLCVDHALGWDGATRFSGRCDDEYTHVAGTHFCIGQNTTLSIENRAYVLRQRKESSCPHGFGLYFDSKICVDKELSLTVKDGLATLDRYLPDSTSPNSSSYNDQLLECPGGLMKPAGEFFCMAFEIALNTGLKDYGVRPAQSRCPADWSRVRSGGFCWPDTGVVPCDAPQAISGLKVVDKPWEDCSVELGNGLRSISSDTAVHPLLFPGEYGFKLKPTVMCAPPGKGVSQMCEGEKFIFSAN